MNCSQIQKLLPLHITADLSATQSTIIAAHLANCFACQAKAEGFSASQNWLQNLATPEFSETQFAQIRAKVFAQIETIEANKISPFWFGWQMRFGLATTALFIAAGIAFFMIHPSPRKIDDGAKEIPVVHTPQSQVATARGTVPKAVARGSLSRTNQKPAKFNGTHLASSPIKSEAIAPANNSQANNAALTDAMPTLQTATEQPQAEAPEMLRIEIQTADPNIKIIWLSPKDTIAANTKADLR